MSEFPVDSAENGDMAAVMENFQKKNAAMVSRPQVTNTSAAQVSGVGSGVRRIAIGTICVTLSWLIDPL